MRIHKLASSLVALNLLAGAAAAQEKVSEPSVAAANAPPALSEMAGCANACAADCQRSRRVYGGADLLIWRLRSAHLPPLVTTGSFDDDPVGAAGQPTTRLLHGNENVDVGWNTGGRFTLGIQSACNPDWSFETTFFILGEEQTSFSARSAGTPGSLNITRPFFNVDADAPDAAVVALASDAAAIRAGIVNVDYAQRLWGVEANAKRLWSSCGDRQVHLLGGFRYLALDESLEINEFTQDLPGTRGTSDLIQDRFAARNRFYGAQFGAAVDVQRGCWTFSGVAKLALGVMDRSVNVSGGTISVNQATGEVAAFGSGLLVQASNRGEHSDNAFAVIPEFSINVSRQLNDRLSVRAGYTFIYLSDVARPADHIDLNIGVQTLPPGPTGIQRPLFPGVRNDDFWAQGFNVGFEFKF